MGQWLLVRKWLVRLLDPKLVSACPNIFKQSWTGPRFWAHLNIRLNTQLSLSLSLSLLLLLLLLLFPGPVNRMHLINLTADPSLIEVQFGPVPIHGGTDLEQFWIQVAGLKGWLIIPCILWFEDSPQCTACWIRPFIWPCPSQWWMFSAWSPSLMNDCYEFTRMNCSIIIWPVKYYTPCFPSLQILIILWALTQLLLGPFDNLITRLIKVIFLFWFDALHHFYFSSKLPVKYYITLGF